VTSGNAKEESAAMPKETRKEGITCVKEKNTICMKEEYTTCVKEENSTCVKKLKSIQLVSRKKEFVLRKRLHTCRHSISRNWTLVMLQILQLTLTLILSRYLFL